MAKPEERIYDGLAQVAHAIRRSTALNVASMILPPESSIEDLKDTAADLAAWIGGKAQQQTEQQEEEQPERQPLGEPWRNVTGQGE